VTAPAGAFTSPAPLREVRQWIAAGARRSLAIPAYDPELTWPDLAACAEVDPDLFYPEPGEPAAPAKRICASCAVREECLEYAIRNREMWGIWGGMTEMPRRRLMEKAPTGLCGKGLHVMDEANTYVNPKTGWKICRACANASSRRIRQERKFDQEAVA
jgi:WhiB family transcriptional regulator, redox-sensing transcriptional regulator